MKKRYLSIIWKNILMVSVVGVAAILIFSAIWPWLFYRIARDELSSYIENSLGESAVRISYMLSGHKATFDLGRDSQFLSFVADYYESGSSDEAGREHAASRIAASLTPTVRSQEWKANGSVGADNYALFIASDGTVIGYPGYASVTRQFRESADYQAIMEQYRQTPPDENQFQMMDPYYPSFPITVDSVSEEVVCCAAWTRSGDMDFCLVSLTPVSDFQLQLASLDSISVTDYAFFCGNTLLWKNREDSGLRSLSEMEDEADLAQYDTTHSIVSGRLYYTVLCSYPSEDLYLASTLTWRELIYPYRTFFRLLQVCVLILIVILTLVFTFLFQRTLLRLKKMNAQMQSIRDGNFRAHVTDEKKDEIGSIAATINEMNDTIQEKYEEQIRSEKEKSRLKYSLLVSAMDPHFIYNTLDTITFLAAMNRTQDIITVNNALIGTLKDRIKMKSLRTSDTVRGEREVLRQYMVIESYLYSEPVDYEFIVSEEDLDLQIPKNILQPLVENAIKHGLMPNKTADRKTVIRGSITVLVRKDTDHILLQVSDNGVGMSPDEKVFFCSDADFSKINPEHIGLANIRLRLQYLYPGQYRFRILDRDGGGTVIEIEIPR